MGEITEIKENEPSTLEGAPKLPPGMADFAGKSADEMLAELRKTPFFMEDYDPSQDTGDNPQIEALKALKEEETPEETAELQKERGNECYRRRQYKEAAECYTKGIEAKGGEKYIDAALYLNRAACNLALKNYRRCINDCKACLERQPKNVKALYRSARALFAIEKYEECQQALEFAVSIDSKSKVVNALLQKAKDKQAAIKVAREKKQREEAEKKLQKETLDWALKARGFVNIRTNAPADTPDGSKIHLEDSNDAQSQLIIPTMVVYPTTDEFDFVSEVSELGNPSQLAEVVMNRPDSYFEEPKHANFRPKKLTAYMETESGGLIKVGKKVTFSQAITKAHAVLFDGLFRVYLVPKVDSDTWVAKWDKKEALEKRQSN